MKVCRIISNLIVVLIFLIMITVPQIVFYYIKDTLPEDNSEKRKLAEKPEFKVESLETYFWDYENYYNDHLPFRSMIRTSWTNFNFHVLNESIDSKVLIGKNEGDKSSTWIFYQNDEDYNPVKETQGILTFSEEEKIKIAKEMSITTDEFNKREIDLYFAVIPNKENLYREMFPDYIKIYEEETRAEKVLKYVKEEYNLDNIIYTKNALEEAKKDYQVYYKQDTHWNDYGAFIGFKTIMENIEPEYTDFEHKVIISEEMIMEKDLAQMLGIKNLLKDKEVTVDFKSDVIYGEMVYETANKIVITTCEDAPIDKTILIVGDSYREAMIPYFSKVYKNVIYTHRCDYGTYMLDLYKPDIVVDQLLERYLNSFFELKLYLDQ